MTRLALCRLRNLNSSAFPADRDLFPLLDISGTAREIGLQHGKALRSRIWRCWDLYASVFANVGVDSATMLDLAETFRSSIEKFDDAYITEIDAIAEGADIEPWKIILLNARSETINSTVATAGTPPRTEHNECTSLHCGSMLGQNWDWAAELEPLCAILRVKRTDCPGTPRMLFMTEPGVIGKVGLNSAGVGVCLNMLQCDAPVGGVPLHVLLRAVLESPSLAAAESKIRAAPRGTMSSFVLGDASGAGRVIELAGDAIHDVSREAAIEMAAHDRTWLLRTNHYLGPVPDEPNASSIERLRRAHELISSLAVDADSNVHGTGNASGRDGGGGNHGNRYSSVLSDAVTVLTDQQAEWPIRRPFVESHPHLGLEHVGTVCSLVMDLRNREMHITRGNPIDYPTFERIPLGSDHEFSIDGTSTSADLD